MSDPESSVYETDNEMGGVPDAGASPGAEAGAGTGLEGMGVKLMEQTSLEQKIQANATKLFNEREIELDKKRLEKAKQQLNKAQFELGKLQERLRNPRTKISQKEELREQIADWNKLHVEPAEQDIRDITARLLQNIDASEKAGASGDGGRLPNETEKDYLIRTGKITAFGNQAGFVVEEDEKHHEPEESVSHKNLRVPGFAPVVGNADDEKDPALDEEEYLDQDDESNTETDDEQPRNRKKAKLLTDDEIRNIDDGVESFYQDRLHTWIHRRSKLRQEDTENDKPEWLKPHPTNPDAVLNNDFRIPGDIYRSLFDYQKTGVQWLYELYQQEHGGIVSDEMGLGKTIQIIAFVAGLHYSGKLNGPVLIVCPATVMTQWVNEFHTWWPPLRTMVLHSIGSGMAGKNAKEEDFEAQLDLEAEEEDTNVKKTIQSVRNAVNSKHLIDTLIQKGHILITSYVGLRIYEDQLLNINWGYVVLDEGHKIKNPNSNITVLSKRLRTHNRVILSGTPIQNNLIELWSLFDFIFPGRLGTLPIFQEEFEEPIKIGGYANATNLQVKVGYQKAVILKELIQPFLLRRMKVDVARDLPSKQEFVLMCRLTKYQRDKYLEFLGSIEGKMKNYLGAIGTLRKICNHPDLADVHFIEGQPGYGDPSRSGKLQVIKSLLPLWKQQGHKVLLFTQTKQMMFILERFLDRTMGPHYRYMKMSGETNIGKRQDMIYSFNNENYDLFLLTTKVGGLGVNLTGADRVIIFDPDWNPSTDLQARERAWRLGQKKEVLIYRLVIGGSIEEKIYHRQIFKQLLTDKILKDPNQKRFFKNSELHDLFTLSDFDDSSEIDVGLGHTTKKAQGDDLGQIRQLTGVSKLEKFKEAEKKESEEDRLMGGLFKNSTVAQARKHDDVVVEHSNPRDDHLEREARRAAQDALDALKKSRKQVKKAGVGVPTFTGKVGSAGKKFTLARSGIGLKANSQVAKQSSSSILANLKNNKDKSSLSPTPQANPANTKIIADMQKYLANQDGFFAKSGDILNACKLEIEDKKDLMMIRSMLKGIAKWDGTRSGWVLNEEFR